MKILLFPQKQVIEFLTIDLSCSYDITDKFQIFGRIENLFDEKYQEIHGFAVSGRSFYAGGKVTF
jgi:vitamin B12 transporter